VSLFLQDENPIVSPTNKTNQPMNTMSKKDLSQDNLSQDNVSPDPPTTGFSSTSIEDAPSLSTEAVTVQGDPVEVELVSVQDLTVERGGQEWGARVRVGEDIVAMIEPRWSGTGGMRSWRVYRVAGEETMFLRGGFSLEGAIGYALDRVESPSEG